MDNAAVISRADMIEEKLRLPVLTVPEAGMVLGFERDAAYLLARQGHIPTFRIGSRLRVQTSALRAMLGIASDQSATTPAQQQAAA